MLRNVGAWLPGYVMRRRARRPALTHIMFCVADHFEPDWGRAEVPEQLARVDRWVRDYPRLAQGHRDADGRPPRWTFFYPAEAYQPEAVERLAALCRQGYGEVEVHLHHDGDTAEGLRRTLEEAKANFARHGLLARDPSSGAVRFGFVHGNWALDNARRDGRWCGVSNELDVLRHAGCYADFTLPSAPSETQTRTINSLYYAADTPQPKSHDTGKAVRVGGDGNGALLMVQGPLALNWRRRKWGLLPRIENGELSATNPPTPQRVDLWVREAPTVQGRADWVFVKIYSHGAKPANAAIVLSDAMARTWSHLERAYNDGTRFRLHYVTAREMVNLIKAAERGAAGEPGALRDEGLRARSST